MLRRCTPWHGPRNPPAFISKLKEQRAAKQVAFAMPSVMSMQGFCGMVEDFIRKANRIEALQRANEAKHRSIVRAPIDATLIQYAQVAEDLKPLLHYGLLKEKLASLGVYEQSKFEGALPPVPFRAARDLILGHITKPEVREFFRTSAIKYVEHDRYVKRDLITGSSPTSEKRTPAACIMGHIDHGKTTLLDTLQSTAITSSEDGKITQTIRAFTIGIDTVTYPTEMSFIDTPGHKLFAEMRLTGARAVDYTLLIVALDRGVEQQTEEVVRSALELKKPVVVAFNKVDLFGSSEHLSDALRSAVSALFRCGLRVHLVESKEALDTMADTPEGLDRFVDGKPRLVSAGAMASSVGDSSIEGDARPLMASSTKKKKKKRPRKETDVTKLVEIHGAESLGKSETQKHAGFDDVPKLAALGVCISALHNANVPLLVNVLRRLAQYRPPKCDMSRPPRQAVVIESWREDDAAVLSCLVRNGILRRGMPFVCDVAHGVITKLTDQFGAEMSEITAGRVGNVHGLEGRGSPAPGIHVMEMPSLEEAKALGTFRADLHRFLQRCPKHAHMLRPEGMDTTFLHVGNYGQVENPETMYDHALLFNQAHTEPATDPRVEQAWAAMQLLDEEQPRTEEEAFERMKKQTPFFVFLKVDSYHSARLLMRELPRLGTRDICFHVLSVGFGAIAESEVAHVPKLDIVISYRAPPLECSKAAHAMERRKTRYREFRLHSQVIDFFKAFAVEKQNERNRGVDPRRDASESFAEQLMEARGMKKKKGRPPSAQQLKNTPNLANPPE